MLILVLVNNFNDLYPASLAIFLDMKQAYVILCFSILHLCMLRAQDSLHTIVAKDGDGIMSILRDEGMDIHKYYPEFLSLNKENIVDGSLLKSGQTYVLPYAPDSFKNRGRRIQLSWGKETALFIDKLHTLQRKDSSLQNAVYYLMTDYFTDPNIKITDTITLREKGITLTMAKELLQHGAKVYVIEQDFDEDRSLKDYIEVINKKYLIHSGSYQRLLILQINKEVINNDVAISISHYGNSVNGQKLARNIARILNSPNVSQRFHIEYPEVFSERSKFYLAKNTLPAMTCIEIGEKKGTKNEKKPGSWDEKKLAGLIANGILMDYTETRFTENED